MEVTKAVTVGTTLGVTGQITSPSFKVTNATDESLLLRATGTAKALTKAELDAAANFVIQPPVTNSTLPNGNSIQLKSLTFDGVTRVFPLQKIDNTAFTPISAENLLVSVGGIIQRPNTDYTTSGSNITFPGSAWTNPPAGVLSCFIIAFGALGGLTQNQDWDGIKGVLLVGSATDNLGIKLGVGSNGQILTADSSTESGVAWKSSINVSGSITGSAITGTSLSAGSGAITGGSLNVSAGSITGGALTLSNNTPSTSKTTGALIVTGGVGIGEALFVGGDITAFASDIRLKTNIEPIENALDKVLTLNGFTYNFNDIGKELGFDTSIRHAGVSAQEIQAILPEVVAPAPVSDEYITVKYEKLVPLLIEAIKELKEEINQLKGGK